MSARLVTTLVAILTLASVAACSEEVDCHDGECHTGGDVIETAPDVTASTDTSATADTSADPDASDALAQRVSDYCGCMLFFCHDDFHARWGVSDEEATAGCRVETGALPVSGDTASTGNFFECRERACGETDCPAALGGATCS